jgi:hypothetical protein
MAGQGGVTGMRTERDSGQTQLRPDSMGTGGSAAGGGANSHGRSWWACSRWGLTEECLGNFGQEARWARAVGSTEW